MRRAFSSVAYVVLCITAFEVWQGFRAAYSKTTEFFAHLDGPMSTCHALAKYQTMKDVCDKAREAHSKGFWTFTVMSTLHTTNWCVGHSCGDLFRDMKTTMYVVGAIAAVVVLRSGLLEREVVRCFRERKRRRLEKWEQKQLAG